MKRLGVGRGRLGRLGRLAQGRAGGRAVGGGGFISPSAESYSAEANAIFAAFSTAPTAARKAQIEASVAYLKNSGVWARLDVLYMLAAANSQAALINWKAPSTFTATIVGSLTFTADRGYTGGDGGTNYLESGFNPTTAPSANYVQDSASYGVWKRENAIDTNQMMGYGSRNSFYPRYTLDAAFIRINQVAEENAGASTDSTGLWGLSRVASDAGLLYRNGALFFTGAAASTALTSNTFFISFGAAAFIGSGLTATQQNSLYQALLVYMQAVGAV